jgi:hypothetical protein
MEKTKPSLRICELPEDIKEIDVVDAGRRAVDFSKAGLSKVDRREAGVDTLSGCIQCLICNGKSGTLRIITHTYKCKYKVTEESGPFIYGNPLWGIGKIDAERSVGILQREYGIANKYTDKNIIGTFGAGPCIILCIRNKATTDTFLAHIDAMTFPVFTGESPIIFQSQFNPIDSDVYIVGGNNQTKDQVYNLLVDLKRLDYTSIQCAYIIDNFSLNNFAINSVTGEVYINTDIEPIKDLPLVYNENDRLNIMKIAPLFRSTLNKVILPCY